MSSPGERPRRPGRATSKPVDPPPRPAPPRASTSREGGVRVDGVPRRRTVDVGAANPRQAPAATRSRPHEACELAHRREGRIWAAGTRRRRPGARYQSRSAPAAGGANRRRQGPGRRVMRGAEAGGPGIEGRESTSSRGYCGPASSGGVEIQTAAPRPPPAPRPNRGRAAGGHTSTAHGGARSVVGRPPPRPVSASTTGRRQATAPGARGARRACRRGERLLDETLVEAPSSSAQAERQARSSSAERPVTAGHEHHAALRVYAGGTRIISTPAFARPGPAPALPGVDAHPQPRAKRSGGCGVRRNVSRLSKRRAARTARPRCGPAPAWPPPSASAR